MNELLRLRHSEADLRRRAQILVVLEEICQEVELTPSQFDRARQAYEAVAKWLSESDDPLLAGIFVYLHGSAVLGTSIKPIGRMEFDVDLIGFAVSVSTNVAPAILKKAIGDRLKQHKVYASILEEKKRCWRLNYAGDFHLDISPTIANPECDNGGELVPDRKLRAWHPTNPRAYRALFERRARMEARLRQSIIAAAKKEALVEPFPERKIIKGILRRLVQLIKRHRDLHFIDVAEEIAPISIVLTTLAMQAYEYCVDRHVFADELEVLVETIRMMPHFIDWPIRNGRRIYAVWNETTDGENFADRWNTEPARVAAFYEWHGKLLSDFEAIRDASGLDEILGTMQEPLGEHVVRKVLEERTQKVSDARAAGGLLLAPMVGLSTTPSAAAVPVPKNEFFGD